MRTAARARIDSPRRTCTSGSESPSPNAPAGDDVGEHGRRRVVVPGVDRVLAPFALGLGARLGGLALSFGRFLPLVRLGLDGVLLSVEGITDVHAVAHEELAQDRGGGQPVQRLGDQAVPVGAVAVPHQATSSMSSGVDPLPTVSRLHTRAIQMSDGGSETRARWLCFPRHHVLAPGRRCHRGDS